MTESVGMDIYVRQKGIDGATVSLEKLAKSADKASSANNKLTREVENTGTAMEAAKKVAAGYFTYAFVKRALDVADKMSTINSQIRLVTASQEEAVSVQKELLKISNKTHASLEATATLYTRTARALKDTNKSQADFLKFSEAINNAMRLGGVGANEQTNALLQLSQALGSGRLQGDEYTSINENAPILLDLVAQKLGVARGELKALSSEGKITSEVIFSALTSASEQLARDAASMPATVGQALNVAGNELNVFADMMLNGTGVTRHMASAIIALSKNIEFVLVPAIGVGAVMAVRTLAASLASLGAVGGPIALAIGALGALLIWLDKNSQKLDEMNAKIASAHTGIDGMVEAQLKKHQQDIEIAVKVNTEELVKSQKEVESLKEKVKSQSELYEKLGGKRASNESLNIKAKAALDNFNKQLVDAENNVANITKEIDTLNRKSRETGNALQNVEINKRQGPIREIAGPAKTADDKAVLKVMADIAKIQGNIKATTVEQIVQQKIQNKEYGEMSDKAKERALEEARTTDLINLQAQNTQTVEGMMESLRIQAQKTGMGMREAFLFDLMGKSDGVENIKEIIAEAETLLNHILTNTPASGKSSIDHYTDRLQDMSRELSEILSLNKELETTGYSSQYNAVSQITLELSDQASTLYKISDAQKQILIGQAQQIDSAHQLNVIMNLGVDYSKRLDDMAFENELIGRSAREVERLRFARELEYQAKLLSIGMSKENIAILEAETQKYKEMYEVINRENQRIEESYSTGIGKGFRDYIDMLGTTSDQTAGAITTTFGHLESSLVNFAQTSKFSFRDMTVSILNDLSKILIQIGIMQAMTAGFGKDGRGGAFGGWLSGLFGYADGGLVTGSPAMASFYSGGYTGPGGKYEEAGLVHKDEFVFNKEATRNLGVGYLNRLHNSAKKGLRGYSDGGSVGAVSAPSFPRLQNQPQKSEPINIEVIVNTEDGSVETNAGQLSSKLKREVNVIVDQRIAKHKRPGGGL